MNDLTIKYQEHRANVVVAHFVKGYEKPIEHFEWFYDPTRQVFIMKLYVREMPSDHQGMAWGDANT